MFLLRRLVATLAALADDRELHATHSWPLPGPWGRPRPHSKSHLGAKIFRVLLVPEEFDSGWAVAKLLFIRKSNQFVQMGLTFETALSEASSSSG